MLTIQCPCCDGTARVDDDLTVVGCETCGVTVDVAQDPAGHTLGLAA